MTSKNHHEVHQRSDAVKSSSDRSFGFVFTGLFTFISGYYVTHNNSILSVIFFTFAVVILITAIKIPQVLAPFNRIWTYFGLLLHKIVNPVVMAIMFFIVITPFGITMRLFGWDPLKRKYDSSIRSYWIERTPPGPDPETMVDQF